MYTKSYICLVYFFLTISAKCHSQLYVYSNPILCDDIRKGINDPNLYKIVKGRFFFKEEYNKDLIYKVIIKEEKSYFVSKELKDKISEVLKNEKCEDVIIEKNPKNKDLKIVRD